MLIGLPAVRAFRAGNAFAAKNVKAVNSSTHPFFISRSALPSWLMIRLQTLASVALLSTATFCAVAKNLVSPGLMGLGLMFGTYLVEVFMHATFTATEAEVQMNSVERCMHYTVGIPEESQLETAALQTKWPEHGAISIKDLVVGYREGPDVLKGISLNIKAGEKVGGVSILLFLRCFAFALSLPPNSLSTTCILLLFQTQLLAEQGLENPRLSSLFFASLKRDAGQSTSMV